jgi:hypothetical protein
MKVDTHYENTYDKTLFKRYLKPVANPMCKFLLAKEEVRSLHSPQRK